MLVNSDKIKYLKIMGKMAVSEEYHVVAILDDGERLTISMSKDIEQCRMTIKQLLSMINDHRQRVFVDAMMEH